MVQYSLNCYFVQNLDVNQAVNNLLSRDDEGDDDGDDDPYVSGKQRSYIEALIIKGTVMRPTIISIST